MNGLAIVFCYLILFSQSRILVLSYPEIINPPVSVDAYLDSWVSFHCEGEGDVLVWQTNGAVLTNEIKEIRNITEHPGITTPGIVNSTLVILAKPDNDGLNIACIVGILGSFVFDSAGADLFVKGIAPVEDLLFDIILNKSASVSWNLPSFISDDVITLLYRVNITNDTDNIVVNGVTIEHKYEVSINMLRLCSIYTVTVTAYGETYTSDISVIQQEYTGEYSASIVENDISVEETGNFTIVFTIMLEGVLCSSTITCFTQLIVPDGEDNHQIEHSTEIIPKDNNFYKYAIHNIGPQKNFIYDCKIEDKLNNVNESNFTTHHVQDFTADVHENGSVYVQCIFANNSNALGCGLNFTERDNATDTLYSVQIKKMQGSLDASGYIDLPVGGNLTVIVFDILENEASNKPAVIYNELPEIKIVKTVKPTQTKAFPSTHFSSSSMYLEDYIHTTVVIYSHEISSNPTVSSIAKSTGIVPEVAVITIPIGTVFISLVIITVLCVIIGLGKRIRSRRQNNINGVCDDDINRNPAYEQVMLQRVVLSQNQAYVSVRSGYECNSTNSSRTYENVPRIL